MKGIFKFLIIAGCVIAVPVVAAYACFYDGSRKDIKTSENYDVKKLMPNKVARAMSNTKTTGKISVGFQEQDFDDLLGSLVASNENVSKFVKQAYIEINGDEYVFVVSAEVPMFKTAIRLYTNLISQKGEDGKDEYTFKINNIKLGRISHLDQLAIAVAKNFISDDVIAEALAKAGFHMTVSLEKGIITYKEADLIADVTSRLSKTATEETSLFLSVMDDLFFNDYLTLNTRDSIDFNIELAPFASNATGMIDDSKSQTIDLETCAAKAKILVKADTIDEEHLQATFEYLVHGYDRSAEDFKTYIAAKDLNAVGIADPSAYSGVVTCNPRPLSEIVGEQTVSIPELMMGGDITFMTEAQANEYVAGTGMIGFSYLIHDEDYENVSYVSIDNFYGNLFRKDGVGHLALVAGVNFTGYETSVIFDLTQNEAASNGYAITFNVDSIHFGEYATNGALSDYLFKLLGASLAGDSTIKVDYEHKSVTVDFSSSIDEATKLAVAAIGTPTMRVEGNGIEDAGRVVASIAA
ncbi:MAG: hypothetical protein MJ239_02540 [Bacilli bacterium]|nr:hypothetical protein [Bacilli bacterium]